jgi:hypothetical protein
MGGLSAYTYTFISSSVKLPVFRPETLNTCVFLPEYGLDVQLMQRSVAQIPWRCNITVLDKHCFVQGCKFGIERVSSFDF